MRKLLSEVVCFLVAVMSSCCLAEIPQGHWMKKDIQPGQTWGESQYLQLNFDNPYQIDGKQFYGSIKCPAGSKMDIIEFAKPEISGNTAKVKAYHYVEYFDEDGGVFFNDLIEDWTIIFDDKSQKVRIITNGGYSYSFGPSDRRNRVVSNTNNLNIRKAPVNGQKIGSMTMCQALPMLSVAPQKNGADWYEIRLPDGNTGFVSSQYVEWVSPSWLSVPEGLIKPNISYIHAYDEPDPDNTRQTTIDFIRKGNQIMCHFFTGYPLVFRLPIDVYSMGHIEENKIILDSFISPLGSDIDVMDIFDSGNFSEFAKHATKMDGPDIFYFDSNYYNGRVFDTSGTEFNAQTF